MDGFALWSIALYNIQAYPGTDIFDLRYPDDMIWYDKSFPRYLALVGYFHFKELNDDNEPGSGADDIGVGGVVGVAWRANSWIYRHGVSGCLRWMYPDDVSKCVRLKYIYVSIMYPDLSTWSSDVCGCIWRSEDPDHYWAFSTKKTVKEKWKFKSWNCKKGRQEKQYSNPKDFVAEIFII